MSEEAKKTPDAPPPPPPSPGVLMEQALIALVDAPGAFARLAARPAPSPAASALAGLGWGLAFFGLNLGHAAASGAAARFAGYPAWQYAAVGAAALAIWAALYLLAAAALYALGRALGGTAGDFDRALEAAAVVAAAGAFQAVAAFVPALWFLPLAAAAWMASCGLAALFGTGAGSARAACAMLAALALAAQFGAGLALDGLARRAAVAALPEGAADDAGMAAMRKQLDDAQAIVNQAQSQVQSAAQPAGSSSLDLLRGPGGEEAPARELTMAEKRALVENMSAQGDAMNKSVLGMLDSLMPMLEAQTTGKNLSARQKADFADIKKMMNEMRASLQSGKPMTPAQHTEQMNRIQQMSMRLMSAGLATVPPAGAAPETKK